MMHILLSKDILKYILVAVLSLLLILVLVIILLISKHNKAKKSVKNFVKKVQELNDFAQSQFLIHLNRLSTIASINDEYKSIYEQYKISHNNIIAKYKNNLNKYIDEINNLASSNKPKLVRNKIQEAQIIYDAYYKSIHELDDDIQKYLNKDSECHESALPYKRQYQKIKEQFLNHQDELALISPTINAVFAKIESIFQEFDDLCNSAMYEEAEEKIKQTIDVLASLDEYIKKVPNLCTKASLIIPEKIESTYKRYEDFLQEEYPLQHLQIKQSLDDCLKQIENIKSRIINFKLKGVNHDLNLIDEEIQNINKLLDEEKNARAFVNENVDKEYKKSTVLERKYIKLQRQLPNYNKVYWIQKYTDDINAIQDRISTVAKIRRELDTYIHSLNRQPYIFQRKKLCELIQENEIIESTLNTFQNYIHSLKLDSDFSYTTLNEKFAALKEEEFRLRELNQKALSEKLMPQFNNAYNLLNGIAMLIEQKPINVEALNDAVSKIIEQEKNIKEEILAKEKAIFDAEKAIVTANQYRQEFHDVRQALNDAEQNFYLQNYEGAFSKAGEAIKSMN